MMANELDRKQLRTLMLYEYRLNHKASEAVRNICSSFGEKTVSYSTVLEWFRKFKAGDFNIDDHYRPGRPVEVDEDRIRQLLEEAPRLSQREIGEILGHDHKTIARHLNRLGKL